jgi:hypothetical protein
MLVGKMQNKPSYLERKSWNRLIFANQKSSYLGGKKRVFGAKASSLLIFYRT